jgi:hypothetical protein
MPVSEPQLKKRRSARRQRCRNHEPDERRADTVLVEIDKGTAAIGRASFA